MKKNVLRDPFLWAVVIETGMTVWRGLGFFGWKSPEHRGGGGGGGGAQVRVHVITWRFDCIQWTL